MNRKGIYNESEMLQRTCKFLRVIRADSKGNAGTANRESNNNISKLQPNMQVSWDKCEGSLCAHWRWHRPYPWSKAEEGGLGYCGLAGKP